MIRRCVEVAVRYRLLVVLAALCGLATAGVAVEGLPRDVLPEFSPVTVEVQTEAAGLSPTEVEQMLTVPLEADLLNGVPWLSSIRSESVAGLSSIVLTFEPGTDQLRARQMVNERVTQAKALPNVSAPPIMLQPLSSMSRVLAVSVVPTGMSVVDASVLARYTIRPRLMSVPGVANVVLWGQQDRQLQIAVEPRKLADSDVTMQQVIDSAGNAMWVSPLSFLEASSPGAGGFIDTSNQRLNIQHISPVVSPETLGQITLEDTPNRVVKLTDVSTITADHPPMIGDAAVAGQGGLLLVVEKFPGADTLAVTRGVEAALDELRPGLGRMRITTDAFRSASYVGSAVSNLGVALGFGGLLAVVALGLLTRSWRRMAVSVASVVMSVAGAVLALRVAGLGANGVVVAGLVAAVGVVIDDAVVDVWRAGRGAGGVSSERVVEPRGTALYAVVAGALAVVAVFALREPDRSLYAPVALAYLLAVAASMLVALTLTPALSALLLDGGRARRWPVSRRWARWHGVVLDIAVGRSGRVMGVAAAVVVAALVALSVLLGLGRVVMIPPLADPNVVVQITAARGTSLPEMNRVQEVLAGQLRAVPGVRAVAEQTGRAVFGDQVVDVNSGQLWVGLDPGADHSVTLDRVRTAVSGVPGVSTRVLSYEQERIEALLGRAPRDITVRLYGQDSGVLSAKAAEVARMLGGVAGVVNPSVVEQPEQPTLVIEPDLQAAQQFGIKPGDVRRAATSLLSGIVVGSLYQDQKIFDVVVRGSGETRHSLSSVRDLLLDTPSGGHIRLGDVADVRVESRPAAVERDEVSRVVDVVADVRGRSLAAASAEVAERLRAIPFPLEHHAELLGEASDHQAAIRNAAAAAAAGAAGIYLLLQLAAGSWRVAGVAAGSLLVAVSGCALAAAAQGGLSLGSVAGMLAVLGIAVRNCVRFIGATRRMRASGVRFGPALVRRAARQGLLPAVSTCLLVTMVLLPAAVVGSVAGLEFVSPLAVVTLGGLVSELFVTLALLPALYWRFGQADPADRALMELGTRRESAATGRELEPA